MKRHWMKLGAGLLLAALASGCGDDAGSEGAPMTADDDESDDDTADDDDDASDDDGDDDSGDDADDDGPDDDGDDDTANNDDDAADDDADDDDGTEPVEGCEVPDPGAAPMRRLSNFEYHNTLVDLLGDSALVEQMVSVFPREPVSLGFRNGADALRINELLADQYVQTALQLSEIVPDVPDVVPCSLDAFDGECVEQFVRNFGKRVVRRPLKSAELQRYANLYQAALDQGNDFRTAIEWISAALLSSPHFLFRVELSSPTSGLVTRPANYEMASRLSYLLWQTMPDDELFRAAEAGELVTEEGIETQVRRMVQSDKALRVYEFFEQWLDLDEMVGISRDEAVYPMADGTLIELLRAENRAFVYDLLTRGGSFADMVSGEYTFANRALAEHYGLSDVPEGNAFVRVEAPGRAGILTQGNLVVHDRTGRTSIVKRGVKIRTDFMCQLVPAPPDNVDLSLPELDGSLSQRERLAQHRTDPSCAACHQLIDPIGEVFEGFDAVGRARTEDEAGGAIATQGSITGAGELNGEYDGVRELAEAFATSDQVRGCFVQQAFRFFYGREVTNADTCSLEQLNRSFARNDYRVVDLLIGLTQSDHFLYRGEPEENTP